MTADNQKPDSSTTTTTTDTAVPSTANQPGTTVEHVIEPQHAETGGEPHERVVAIALDNSQYSEHAFKWAMNNLIDPARDLVVLMNVRPYVSAPILYTAPMMDLGDVFLSEEEYYKLDETNKRVSHDLIRHFAADLIKRKIKCKGIALRGDAREEIVYKVDDIKADVLVIGSRGMGALKRTFIGSTSDYCVHHCHCTVIVPKA